MAFLILEGLDRTGKSTVAELYKERGYEIVHLSTPDKKYTEPGYTGPSYLDEILELIMQYDGKDVVWDRSWYGETVWPHVYNRQPLLEEDELDILRDFETKNSAQRILMIDPNAEAHWKRCVENNEPLDIQQFKLSSALFNKMAHKYNFIPQQLEDFDVKGESEKKDTAPSKDEAEGSDAGSKAALPDADAVSSDDSGKTAEPQQADLGKTQEQEKLEKANAINSILSKRIVRSKGLIFDKLETDIKVFLQQQLSNLLGTTSEDSLSDEEVQILKIYCQRIKEKSKTSRG
jgi:thymidylate kinase